MWNNMLFIENGTLIQKQWEKSYRYDILLFLGDYVHIAYLCHGSTRKTPVCIGQIFLVLSAFNSDTGPIEIYLNREQEIGISRKLLAFPLSKLLFFAVFQFFLVQWASVIGLFILRKTKFKFSSSRSTNQRTWSSVFLYAISFVCLSTFM